MQQRPRPDFGIRWGIVALKRAITAIIGLLLLAGCSADVKIPEQPASSKSPMIAVVARFNAKIPRIRMAECGRCCIPTVAEW